MDTHTANAYSRQLRSVAARILEVEDFPGIVLK